MKYFIGCNKQFFQIKFHPYRRYLLRPIEFISPYPLPFLPFKFLNIVEIKNVTNKGHCKGIPAILLEIPAYPQKKIMRSSQGNSETSKKIWEDISGYTDPNIYPRCISVCLSMCLFLALLVSLKPQPYVLNLRLNYDSLFFQYYLMANVET